MVIIEFASSAVAQAILPIAGIRSGEGASSGRAPDIPLWSWTVCPASDAGRFKGSSMYYDPRLNNHNLPRESVLGDRYSEADRLDIDDRRQRCR